MPRPVITSPQRKSRMTKVSSKSAGLVGAFRMTTCQVVSAGWPAESGKMPDFQSPITRRSLYRKRRAEDCAPYLSSDVNFALQRDFHSIVRDAHLNTAFGSDGAELGGYFALVACDDFRTAMRNDRVRHALFLAPRQLRAHRRVAE